MALDSDSSCFVEHVLMKKLLVSTLKLGFILLLQSKTTQIRCMHFQHKQGHSYLLVTEVMETIFKFIVSALCALPKPLQHLQKKRARLQGTEAKW